MADIDLNPIFEGISKKLGNLVFVNRYGDIYVKRNGKRKEPISPAQLAVQKAFGELAHNWFGMNGIMHAAWESRSKKKKVRGYNLFMKANFKKQYSGEPLDLFISMGQDPLTGLQAAPGTSPGEITCTFNTVNSGRHVSFFTQKKEEGTWSGRIIRHDGGANTASPFTLSGLETGGEYLVYAVVTDTVYDQATTVSGSVHAVAAAG